MKQVSRDPLARGSGYRQPLRHEYQEIRVDMLWHIATSDLDDLERAVDAMLGDLGRDAGDGQP
jgi:uncharacterized protein with HEPN domain